MKSIEPLKEEVVEILKEIQLNKKRKKGEVGYITPGGIKKMKARKEYLDTCIAYLQTNPSPDFIEKEKSRLLNRNNVIMDGLPKEKTYTNSSGFIDSKRWKKAKKEYEKLMELPKVRLQLKTLNFIS